MKRTLCIVTAILMSLSLLCSCGVPKVENEYFISADDGKWLNAKSYSEGLAAVCNEDGWGFVDLNGEMKIPCSFEATGFFSEGLCSVIVKENGNWGYINTEGKVVIEPSYHAASAFSDGYALVKKGNYYSFIDKNGKTVEFEYIKDEDTVKISEFDEANSFVEDFASVQIDGKWGFVNTDKKVCIAPSYLTDNDFSEGLCAVNVKVEKKDLSGFIDVAGNLVIPADYVDAGAFSEGFAPVKLKVGEGDTSSSGVTGTDVYGWGYIDKNGKIVISPVYDNVYGFNNGLSRVSDNVAAACYKFGFINAEGKEVTERIYDYAYDMTADGLARVAKIVDGKAVWGYVDKTGAEYIKLQFDEAKDFYGGFAPVRQGDKWGIINKRGEVVVDFLYDDLDVMREGHVLFEYKDKFGFLKAVNA